MPQLNLYVPAGMDQDLRRRAKQAGKSLSAYILDVFRGQSRQASWPKGFFTKMAGGWQGTLPVIDRPPPEDIE